MQPFLAFNRRNFEVFRLYSRLTKFAPGAVSDHRDTYRLRGQSTSSSFLSKGTTSGDVSGPFWSLGPPFGIPLLALIALGHLSGSREFMILHSDWPQYPLSKARRENLHIELQKWCHYRVWFLLHSMICLAPGYDRTKSICFETTFE